MRGGVGIVCDCVGVGRRVWVGVSVLRPRACLFVFAEPCKQTGCVLLLFGCWVCSYGKKKYGYGKNKYSKEDKYEDK